MYTIRKLFSFEAAHILASAYSKCCTDSIHGHSYKVEVFIRSEDLNDDQMVVDFGKLKSLTAGLWKRWDHSLTLPEKMKGMVNAKPGGKAIQYSKKNPTAEWMAKEFFDIIDHGMKELLNEDDNFVGYLWKVRVHETDTGWAEWEKSERKSKAK